MLTRSVCVVLVALTACFVWSPAARGAGRQQAPLLRIPLAQDDGSLTPYTFTAAYPLVTLVYDTLLWRDSKGVPRPWLARSVKRSRDGNQLRIRLARGVKWHDGRPLTADDVAFTFDFMRTRRHPRFTPQLRDLESVIATGPNTVVIRLRRPSLGFLDQPLADVPILPKHLWEGLPPGRLAPGGLPVGSGPYRLVTRRPRKGYRFQSNDDYFRGRPTVRTIRVPFIPESDRAFRALDAGRADMVPLTLPEDPSREFAGLDVDISRGPSYLGTVLMFNLRRPPFDRREVRKAVSQALDLPRIAGAFGDLGETARAVPADRGYLHPASRWSSPRELQTFDEDAAQKALERFDLAPIRVLAPDNDPVREEAGRQVVLALGRAGARARLDAVAPDALAEAVGRDASAPTFDVAIWNAPPLASNDPDFLQAVFGSGEALNYSGYRSRKFEALADLVATSRDRRSRRAAVARELRLLAGDAPVVPLFFYDGIFASRRAAYDGWLFVKGSGILDKRSFLPRRASDRAARGGERIMGEDDSSRFPIGLFGLLALGLVAVAFAVVVGAALRRGA